MIDYSIECAPPYGHEWDGAKAAEALQSLLASTRKSQGEASLVLLVDDASYEDKSFDFDSYSNWLRAEGFNPNLVARESQITQVCDMLLSKIDFTKLDASLAAKLQSEDRYISQLFIASWCLLRLGYLQDKNFDASLRANRLVNILPESFRAGEDESLAIIRATPFAEGADKIEYIFIPEKA